jgi:GTP cyclohydrolase I
MDTGETWFRELLTEMGEDPDRPGLARTPARVREALLHLTRGYREDLPALLEGGVFEETSRDTVLVRDLEFLSLCEHHVLPFLGHVHVGYVPDGRIAGLSRIARVVDVFACRLQVQERMTGQIADALEGFLKPAALGVVVTARHLCMKARGVHKGESDVVTSAWRGPDGSDPAFREALLRQIGRP